MNSTSSRFFFARSVLAIGLVVATVAGAPPAARMQAAEACVFTRGYWRNHTASWPVRSLVLGNTANPAHRYSQSELVALLVMPARGDASLILAAQLIAARLNVAGGSNPAPIAGFLARADALFGPFAGRLPYRIASSSPLGSDMTATAAVLDAYNNGLVAGSCGTGNHAPIAYAGADQTVTFGTIATLDGSASSDRDGDTLSYAWTFLRKPAASLAVLSDASAINPTFTVDAAGEYELQLVVSDGIASSIPDQVLISTNNLPPVAVAGDDTTATVGDRVTLDGSASHDADGDALTFAWSFVSKPIDSTAAFSDPAAVNPGFTIDRFGEYVVQLIVHDGAAASLADTVVVSTINSRPVANAGADQPIVVGVEARLDASGSTDVDGNPLTYRWALTRRPDGSTAALSDAAAVNPTFVPDLAGTYVAQLTVNDGALDSEPDTVLLTTENRAPVANAGDDYTVALGATVMLDGTRSRDPDGDELTFRWSLLSIPPGSGASLSDTTSATPTFEADRPGEYVAQLVVSDGALQSAPSTVTISTENSRPRADAGPDQTVETGATVQLNGSASHDPDGTPLRFAWSLLNRPMGSVAEISDPENVAPQFNADVDGLYVVQLIVGDGALLSDPDTMSVSAHSKTDLAIEFVDPPAGTHAAGTAVTFGARVANLGPIGAADVRANVLLPAGYTAHAIVPSAGAYDAASGDWVIGPLTAGADVRLDVQATLNATGPLELRASITGSSRDDPDLSNNSALAAPANRPPQANAGADQLVTAGLTATLDAAASADPDGDVLAFEWTLTARPATSAATLTGAATAAPSFVADREGQFVAELVVRDGRGGVSSDAVVITSEINRPPFITSSPVTTGRVGAPYEYGVGATDANGGDTLTFSLPIAPAGMTIDPASGVIRWTPLGSQTGINQVAVHVRDRAGQLAAQGFSVDVSPRADNTAPRAEDDQYDARTGDALGVPAPGVLGNDIDPDGNRLRARALTQPANGTAVVNPDGSFTYTPFTFEQGELVPADNVNLAINVTGATAQASTFATYSGNLGRPESAFDGSPGTSWFTVGGDAARFGTRSITGALPFIEVRFPIDVDVRELQVLGHRDPFLANFRIFAGRFQLFDATDAELFDSGIIDLPLPNRDGKVVVADLFQRSRNVARTVPGVVYRASSARAGRQPEHAFDGDLRTQWTSAFNVVPPQFLEVEFPAAVDVHRVKVFGTRDSTGATLFNYVVQVFDAAGQVLFDSGTVVSSPTVDSTVEIGGVSGARRVRITGTAFNSEGMKISEFEVISTETVTTRLNGTVRRARFTDTADGSGQVGLAEFRVLGTALVRRQPRIESNVAHLLPTSASASSFAGAFNVPEHAIDDTTARNWYATTGAAGEFLDLEFPRLVTVSELRASNPSARPDGFGTSLGIDCSGSFTLHGADGAVLFDSGAVRQPFGALNASITFTLPVPNVGGVKRVRYTSAGCGPSFPPGFSEFRVFGTADVEVPPLDARKKFQALVNREAHSTSLVANLTDDNGDGRIDRHDVPDIIVAVEATTSQLTGEIKVVSGDDGRDLMTMGAPNLVSPWAEPAVGDIDGDGLPEIIAVHSGGNNLIAFKHTGEQKWISAPHPMPRFAGDTRFVGGAVSIANLDGAGPPEIIVAASVFSADGQLIGDGRTLAGTTGGTGLRSAVSAVGDIDLDGIPELVAGPTAYRLSGGTLQIAWRRTDRADGYVGIANFDDDPFAEIVIVANGFVYMLNHDGTDVSFWNAPSNGPVPIPGGGQGGAPTIGDVDGDGVPEIGVAGARYFSVLNRDGSVRWKAVTSDVTSNATGATVFDLDADGSVEVIYRDEVNLRIWRGADGVLLAKIPMGSSTWTEVPVVADVDNDGHADIVVTSDRFIFSTLDHSGVYVLYDVANRWQRTRRVWNQHSYHVTNVDEDGTIPSTETPHFLIPELNSFRLNALVADRGEDNTDRFTYVATDGDKESQPATVRIAVRTRNSAPRIISTGVDQAANGVLYLYAVRASDPDAGDILTFSLPTAPAGMTIDAATGLVQWTPSDAQRGTHDVVVKVQDLKGLFALQGYSVQVGEAVAVPDVVGTVQSAATASIAAANLTPGAIATRHSPTVPADTVIGQNPAAGTLMAPRAAVDLVVSVGPAPTGTVPDVVGQQQASAQADIVAAGFSVGAITGRHSATAPAGVVLSQSPAGGSQAETGTAIALVVSLGVPPGDRDQDGDGFTGNQGDCNDTDAAIHPGAVDVAGDGIDQNCNGTDSVDGDDSAPTASISSPVDGTAVTMPVEIVGTAIDEHFLRYRLEFGSVDALTPAVLGGGTAPVVNAVLGRIDPTLLENGLYRARLVVEDVNGRTAVDERVYRVTGTAKVGVMAVSFVDLQVPVSGIPITVIRSYDSRVKTQRDFGVGWSLQLKTGAYQHNRPPGQGWIVNDQPFLGEFLPCIGGVTETKPHFTEVRLSEREFYLFALTLSAANLGITGACEATASFRFVDGTTPGATLDILDGTTALYLRGGEDQVVDMNAFLDGAEVVYNPLRVRLATIDGRKIDFDRVGGITRIEDLNGNALTISAAGVAHSSGKSIAFTRDAAGRISRITDPNGNTLRYAYDSRGDLSEFIDQASNTTTFAYDAQHNLLEIRDPLGNRAVRSEYDADGRLVAVIDASGRRTIIAHSLATRTETITDRLGKISVIEYDDRGNVLRQTDPLGHATTFTYDARDNKLSETDALGNTRTYTYDASGNLLTDTDALGNTTTLTYNARSQMLSRTDPGGGVREFSYDSRGNVLTERDELGNKTTHAYDARGNLLRTTDPLGAIWVYHYDAAGNKVRSIDPLGNVTTRAFDANGNLISEVTSQSGGEIVQAVTRIYQYDPLNRLVRETDPEGGATHKAYTATGAVAATTDPLGRQTEHTYDEQNRLTSKTFPDGTSEGWEYDAEGRRVAWTDQSGRITRYGYDSVGRLTDTVHPDGSTIGTLYDRVGRVMSTINERGDTTTQTYDAAGRRTTTADALANVTAFDYDTNGNLTTIRAAQGQTVTYAYDAANRRTRVEFADGTARTITYDGAGRIVAEADQAGRETRYGYDGRGRLVTVTDALDQITTYGYDERGNLISQTDAGGRTIQFEYDGLGRRKRRFLPLGQVETFTYDPAGNLASRTDFRGKTTTYAYDALDRLIRKTPDPTLQEPAVAFAYTATGQRASMMDASGTTSYAYDERDRVIAVARPEGTLTYTYDPRGNVLGMRSSNAGGVSVAYAHDAANRLTAVVDERLTAGTTTYTYDATGKPTEYIAPNGVTTAYGYDDVGRLTDVDIRRGASPLARFSYSLGAAGNRTAVTEHDGRTVAYDYDALYRLTGETIGSDPKAEDNGTIAYTYDAVGNRLTRDSTIGRVAPATYAYDANDRLTAHGYDANGNTTVAGGRTYTYDFENRITSLNGGAVTFVYDGDGNRVAKTVDGVTTRYLVDGRNVTGFTQVVEEIVDGAVDRAYTYGRSLVNQRAGDGATNFYGHDATGSVRLLTDGSGAPVDSYRYDAFGNLLHQSGAVDNLYRFAGEQFDPDLNLTYLRARYVDAQTGRFHTMDTYPGLLTQPMSLHKYLYAHASPVDNVDPSGQHSVLNVALGVIVVVAVANLAGSLVTLPDGRTQQALTTFTKARNLKVTSEVIRVVNADWFFALLLFDPFGWNPLSSYSGISGASRNLLLSPVEWGVRQAAPGCTMEGFTALVCTGIARTAERILNEALQHDTKLKAVVKEVDVRSRTVPIPHDALLVTTHDGQELIFDWHATLDPLRPLVTPYESWRH